MSVAWNVGFVVKPELGELDKVMLAFWYEIEPAGQRRSTSTRIYVVDVCSVQKAVELLYKENPTATFTDLFGDRANEIVAYGDLVAHSVERTYPNADERLRIIAEKAVRTQHDYYKHVAPEHLKWYETALELRNKYKALILSEQTCREINPDESLPEYVRQGSEISI